MYAYQLSINSIHSLYIHTPERLAVGDHVTALLTQLSTPATKTGVITWAGLSWCADLGSNAIIIH